MEILGGLSSVSVDGVTITGNGTPASPLVGSSGTPAGWPITWWATPPSPSVTTQKFANPANTIALTGFSLEARVRFSNLIVVITTLDAGGLYDLGLYNAAGTLVAHIGAQAIPAAGLKSFAIVGGPIELPPGRYYLASTGNATVAAYQLGAAANSLFTFFQGANQGSSALGVLPSTITPPADSVQNVTGPMLALST